MPSEPIRFINRADGSVQTERIFGEKWLRWTYETPEGRLALALFAKRALFSRYYGWRMNLSDSGQKVLPFIADYEVDAREFAKSPFAFRTFNQFFYRALKEGARPVAPGGDQVAVLPADGRHLAFQDVSAAEGFYVKGAKFTVAELLGAGSRGSGGPAGELAALMEGGSMLISRLCPTDYHRFHFPVAGMPGEARLVKGWLYSVSPVALRRNIRYLVENKRMVTRIDSAAFGPVAMVEVGATAVGSILQGFLPGRAVERGTEKGFFAFGGSCVITLFGRGRVRFEADLVDPARGGLEVYAKMGERLGVALG